MEQYVNTVGLMRVLLIFAFLNSVVRFTVTNILATMGEIKYNMIVSGVGIAIQVALDFLLIPVYEVIAIAVSNCFVFGTISIMIFA